MKQYKIWNSIENNSYKSSNSFGVNDTSKIDMLIGTSKANSFFFGEISQNVFWQPEHEYYSYQLFIDGVAIKEAHYYPKTKIMKMWNIKNGVYIEYFNNEKKKTG